MKKSKEVALYRKLARHFPKKHKKYVLVIKKGHKTTFIEVNTFWEG